MDATRAAEKLRAEALIHWSFPRLTIQRQWGQLDSLSHLEQPAFFRTDSQEGHAYLISVKDRSAREAMSRLKRSMRNLFRHLTAD